MLLAVPRTVELRFAETGGQLGALPTPPLLHGWFRAPHIPWLAAIPRTNRTRAHTTDVGCQEHDVRGRSAPREIPHRVRNVPRPNVDQGS